MKRLIRFVGAGLRPAPTLFLVLLVCARAHAADWPIFRGNSQLTGVATESLPQRLESLWTFQAGSGIESTAAISNGIVYVGSLDGYLYAVDLQSGKLKWKYQATDEIKSSPSVYRGTVYFGDEKGM